MTDQWDFYFASVNDNVASIFVDMGLGEMAPDASKPWLLWAIVPFKDPREDGLSTDEESEVLDEIEDALLESVESSIEGSLVGRITTEGRREFYFYAPTDEGFEQAVGKAMASHSEYEVECGAKEDPDWEHYLGVLFPSPYDLHCINNRHVLEQLRECGDDLESERMVFHWAYFPTEEARARFITEVSQRGFEVTDQEFEENSEFNMPYGVGFERVDHVDWDSINEVTLDLYELAETCDGDYDGWETSVEASIDSDAENN